MFVVLTYLFPSHFQLCSRVCHRRVQVNQNGLKLNGTYHFLVSAADDNTLGESIHTLKKNSEALLISSKEIGLEVNSDKTKYVVMSQDWNAGQSHNIKIDNSSLKGWKSSKCLGTTVTNRNSIQEEIKSILKSGNAYYHSVQSLLSPSLLSRNMKIKIYLLNYLLTYTVEQSLS